MLELTSAEIGLWLAVVGCGVATGILLAAFGLTLWAWSRKTSG